MMHELGDSPSPMLDLLVSLILSGIISIVVKVYFDDSGLGAFPVLTFLVVTVLSYMAISFVHSLIAF